MLTLVEADPASGNSTTRRPLASRYSEMPSTVATWLAPGGNAALALANARRSEAAKTRRFMGKRCGKGPPQYSAGQIKTSLGALRGQSRHRDGRDGGNDG